ncbi:DUF1826 domain-containing protein, partial [Escherichia coli]|nr:DUF1826 domain-containing protein [Escherichia coli]
AAVSQAPPAPGIARGQSISVLRRISDPTVALALWERKLSRAFALWLDTLAPDRLPHGRVLAGTADAHAALAAVLHRSATPDHPMA